jgi:hypothetical protein
MPPTRFGAIGENLDLAIGFGAPSELPHQHPGVRSIILGHRGPGGNRTHVIRLKAGCLTVQLQARLRLMPAVRRAFAALLEQHAEETQIAFAAPAANHAARWCQPALFAIAAILPALARPSHRDASLAQPRRARPVQAQPHCLTRGFGRTNLGPAQRQSHHPLYEKWAQAQAFDPSKRGSAYLPHEIPAFRRGSPAPKVARRRGRQTLAHHSIRQGGARVTAAARGPILRHPRFPNVRGRRSGQQSLPR